jgi:hypothetical protein
MFLPSCGGAYYKLSKTEYKEAIEQAKQGNLTAIENIKWHYLYNRKSAIFRFYEQKLTEMRNTLSNEEYILLSEQAETGNETAAFALKKYNWAIQDKQDFQNFLDNNMSAVANFLNDCSHDSFCNSSDIYEYYSQKAKNTDENKTQ